MAGRIVLLNGASSAGKTTLARALQRFSSQPMQLISLDQFRDGMAGRYRGMNARADEPGAQGLNVVPSLDAGRPLTQLRFGDTGRLTLKGMRRAVAAFARVGIDVVVDDLLLEASFLEDYLRVLNGLAVLFVGVYCDPAVLASRESARAGRFPGTAAAHAEQVHAGCRYDVEVDTTSYAPHECAEQVLAALRHPSNPSAFDWLRRR